MILKLNIDDLFKVNRPQSFDEREKEICEIENEIK